MSAVIREPISETLPVSTGTTMPALSVDETIGWKTEAQRLAQAANRCVRELR
jgi:hypothetical protein